MLLASCDAVGKTVEETPPNPVTRARVYRLQQAYRALRIAPGGDSRAFAGWMPMPELLHVGALLMAGGGGGQAAGSDPNAGCCEQAQTLAAHWLQFRGGADCCLPFADKCGGTQAATSWPKPCWTGWICRLTSGQTSTASSSVRPKTLATVGAAVEVVVLVL